MKRRHFLKLAVGFTAGAAAFAASAEAAPLLPQPPMQNNLPPIETQPAVVTADEVAELKPEQVRWGHHRHWHRHWHHRRWHWHRRHWGWHRHHWRRHRW